jgi:hypothetical protein
VRKGNQDVPKPSISRLRCAIYTRKSTDKAASDQLQNKLEASFRSCETLY